MKSGLSFTVRPEEVADADAIRSLHQQAFGGPLEGRLVDALRANDGVVLSLVAVVDDRVVGHVLFSPVSIDSDAAPIVGAGLGPMAVATRYQRQGIGTRLIETGCEALRARGCPCIVVLGHPGYYPRFGFTPVCSLGLQCEWDVPDDAFMVLILDHAAMDGVSGWLKYRDEFNDLV